MSRSAYNPNAVDDLPLFGGRREPETGAEAAAPVSPRALLARDRAIESLSKNAGEEFIRNAQDFVLEYLKAKGPHSSEQLTDACKAAGIKPHDDKAFGAVYGGLARRGKIVKVGSRPRDKGHASGLTWVWKAAK
jgi:hypothetical protein